MILSGIQSSSGMPPLLSAVTSLPPHHEQETLLSCSASDVVLYEEVISPWREIYEWESWRNVFAMEIGWIFCQCAIYFHLF